MHEGYKMFVAKIATGMNIQVIQVLDGFYRIFCFHHSPDISDGFPTQLG